MNDSSLIKFDVLGDERGNLIALENQRHIPFDVRRVYYIYGTKGGSPRGFHAHKTLRQLMICVAGSCKVLLDDGTSKVWYTLDRADQGLRIDPLVWHEMHDLSADCVLVVLADQPYDETDYLREYGQFLQAVP